MCFLVWHSGGGELEDEVMEMTLSRSGSQFLLHWEGGSELGGEERKRGIFDVQQDWVNEESMAGG